MATNASQITPEVVEQHGLSPEEYERVLNALGREPNLLELGIFSVMWSEHCSYKSSRLHLKKLPTEAEWVICGPGENAGVIDIGDGQAAIFKMESHNHPSYIEPYQGAATGVGGILRDVFTMGARPVANANALRFGRPDHPKMKHLVQGVVAGIGGYGNCVGVPTVAGETNFDPAYDGNILVNAMTVGVADADKIFYSAATGVGNPIVYVGSKTGRDGIHGATMASADFEEDAEAKRPTVQVGDPFTEKLLIEACLELMATDAIVAIQDMGAAGLTSSSVEMASNGGVGIRLKMDDVPQREEGMTPYEMMLSESQERMLMVLKPGKEDMARAIFEKWELDFAVIGEVTDTGRMVLDFEGETVCDIPLGPLADDAPLYDRPYLSREEYTQWARITPMTNVPDSADVGADLLKLMGSPALASRRWIFEQYDRQVGADTLQTGGDAGVVRVHGTKKALAISTDCTPRYVHADPYEGGKQAVAEAFRNLCAVGAKPLAITNCLNFANPQRPEIMAQIVHALDGMGEACRTLDFPVVSGNVSLYNESKATGGGSAILPCHRRGRAGRGLRQARQHRFQGRRRCDLPDRTRILGQARSGPLAPRQVVVAEGSARPRRRPRAAGRPARRARRGRDRAQADRRRPAERGPRLLRRRARRDAGRDGAGGRHRRGSDCQRGLHACTVVVRRRPEPLCRHRQPRQGRSVQRDRRRRARERSRRAGRLPASGHGRWRQSAGRKGGRPARRE